MISFTQVILAISITENAILIAGDPGHIVGAAAAEHDQLLPDVPGSHGPDGGCVGHALRHHRNNHR